VIPKKPILTAARKVWLASLKPGNPVLLWRYAEGWLQAIVADKSQYLRHIRDLLVEVPGRDLYGRMSSVAPGSGCATTSGQLAAVVYPADDRDALAAFWTDEQRRALRNVDWHKVDDSTVQCIADMLRLDIAKPVSST
jgi:hypothetical protein